MANLTKVLGTMLVSGLAGRTGGRGAALATAAPMLLGGGRTKGGMGLGGKAGMAALAYLAYKTYRDSGSGSGSGGQAAATPAEPAPKAGASGPFAPIFDALGVFQPTKEVPAEPQMNEDQALLLIRAMISAANADGQITAEERQRIVQHLDKAGAGPEERQIVEQEIRQPRSTDDIIRQVKDQDTAEQVYLASEIAIRGGSETERRYLDFLASRLNIPDDRRRELDSVAS
ncbi:tellurite resistance TerB family protein [Skermanella pratensis]|uniref:tellurite resistance TerB family protein n=1 Tax=Skermanella pratensis TaxID=2233999 RepID=UPI00130161D3|nr:DUF533 domain-containing protein [Skermanella pratensis]